MRAGRPHDSRAGGAWSSPASVQPTCALALGLEQVLRAQRLRADLADDHDDHRDEREQRIHRPQRREQRMEIEVPRCEHEHPEPDDRGSEL